MSDLRIYKEDFEPIARTDEVVLLLPDRKAYKVLQVEPIQPIVKNFGALLMGASSNVTKLTELELEENELGQWRFEPLDDVQLALFCLAANRKFSTKYTNTEIEKTNPRHSVYIPVSTGANTVLWTVTPGRVARIKKIVAGGATTQKLRFNDAGTDAFSVNVPAASTVVVGENHCPNIGFITNIRNTDATSADVSATIEIEESNIADVFKNNQNKEMFHFYNDDPSAQVTNPLAITQAVTRVSISGFRYSLDPYTLKTGDKYIAVPVRAMPISRASK